jgi:DNA-binding transcriptional regulator WhiA
MSRRPDLRRHSHNESYFKHPTNESSYWAGFIAADGSLCDRNYSLSVGLAEKDRQHLIKLKAATGYSGRIRHYEKTNSCDLCIYSAQEYLYDLENVFNITPNKSRTLNYPEGLVMLNNDNLIKSYMAGYIDGDGCIKLCERDSTIILDIFSGSKKIIDWMNFSINEMYGIGTRKIYSYSDGHTYRIQGRLAHLVLSDIKKLSIPVLSRKWCAVEKYAPKRRLI